MMLPDSQSLRLSCSRLFTGEVTTVSPAAGAEHRCFLAEGLSICNAPGCLKGAGSMSSSSGAFSETQEPVLHGVQPSSAEVHSCPSWVQGTEGVAAMQPAI